jgi:hypothetical protein
LRLQTEIRAKAKNFRFCGVFFQQPVRACRQLGPQVRRWSGGGVPSKRVHIATLPSKSAQAKK